MTPSLNQTVQRFTLSLLLGTASATVFAQTTPPATPYLNRNLIVLDPAHGGDDHGATVNGQLEKDITLAFAANLRTLLTASGFTVVSTREADIPAGAALTTDQRAGTANHLRPAACITLHATGIGTGVHLATSSLPLSLIPYEPSVPIPWESAQTPYLAQSQRLANDLGLALLRAKVPVLLTRADLRPLDNLTCPAVAIEIAPLASTGQRPIPVTDPTYQQRILNTLAFAILTWRDTTLPPPEPKPAKTAGATP